MMIRKFLRRWSRKLHRFLGLVLGIPFALICISGALLAFEPQLLRLVHPEHYRVDVAVRHERLPVDEVYARVSSQLPDTVQLGTLRIGQPDETWQIEIASLRNAELFVNPYTGKITGMQDHDRGFFYEVRRLHRWFFDTYDHKSDALCWGKLAVGVVSLLSLPLLLFGLYLWFPPLWRSWKLRVQICFRHGLRRALYDVHVTGGFHTVLLLLVLALTGLTWSFPWYRQAFYATFGVVYGAAEPSGPQPVTDYRVWQRALKQVEARHPDYRWIEVSPTEIRFSTTRYGNARRADVYHYEAPSGRLTRFIPYRQTSAQQRVRGWIVTLHEGLWLGWFSQLLTCLGALVGACLPFTAYYLYCKRRYRHR